jgi:hypothetical protein
MQMSNGYSAEWVVKALASGRFAEKLEAQRLLSDTQSKLDLAAARDELLRLIKEDYSQDREKFDELSDLAGVRCWLLSALGYVPLDNGEPESTLAKHLDPVFEANHWARYWTLAALLRRKTRNLSSLCQPVAAQDPDYLPKMLATAILAHDGSNDQRREHRKIIKDIFEDPSKSQAAEALKWAVLRALRFVYLPFAVKPVCSLVLNAHFDDNTYDAIVALGNVPPDTPQAEDAGLALMSFITRYRRYQFWDVMRIRAIDSLGQLKLESSASLLLEELTDYNPSIAKQAALALETILGPPTTVSRVLELLGKRGDLEISRFARGLREMQNQKAIAEELGVAMISYTGPAQEHVQRLLSEIGGVSAFQKLRSLTQSTERYVSILEKADESLREQFESTIGEARSGFKLVIAMDMIVFLMGVILISLSAILALKNPTPLVSWSSWITGTGGVLAVLYGRFIARPRQQVEASVQYLSGLKAVFLGYLRQLRQTDQAYTRRVLDEKPLTAEETKGFNALIEEIMERSMQRLTAAPTMAPKEGFTSLP